MVKNNIRNFNHLILFSKWLLSRMRINVLSLIRMKVFITNTHEFFLEKNAQEWARISSNNEQKIFVIVGMNCWALLLILFMWKTFVHIGESTFVRIRDKDISAHEWLLSQIRMNIFLEKNAQECTRILPNNEQKLFDSTFGSTLFTTDCTD